MYGSGSPMQQSLWSPAACIETQTIRAFITSTMVARNKVLNHGSSIGGGARPKALIQDGNTKYVAKFSSTTDHYNVVKGEFLAMRLAEIAGLNVAPVRLERSAKRDVLLVERFDRTHTPKGFKRHMMVSALTMFELDEMMARYASYEQLADIIRQRFTSPSATLLELYKRLVINYRH